MYALKSYGSMQLKAPMYKKGASVCLTDEAHYSGWRSELENEFANKWLTITSRFGDDVQFAILRALTVTGVHCGYWNYNFKLIADEYPPYEDFAGRYIRGSLSADWRYFATAIALEVYGSTYFFPCVYPEWLFPYGYSQRQYHSDLALYWDNIPEGYKTPWNIAPMNHDTPAIARLKRLAQAARSEIDQVALHGKKHLNREGK